MKSKNDIQNLFIDLIETVANGKTNVLSFDDNMQFYRGEIHIIKSIGDEEGIYTSEIASRMGVTRAVIHKTINKLESRGMVYKVVDEEDRKRKKLYLTEEGKRAYQYHEDYHKKHDAEFISYLEHLSDSEYDTIKEFLEKANGVVAKHF